MNAAVYEAIQSLRLVNCGQCGCLFAVPAALAGGELHCPHGHAFTPAPWDELEACGKIVKLQTALADARVRLEAAKARVEALTPLAEPTAGELRRRSRLLAEHAEDAGRGQALCPFCGAGKLRTYLPEHLRRRHRQLLIEDGAEKGGSPG